MNFALTHVEQQNIPWWDSFQLEFLRYFCWAMGSPAVCPLISLLPAVLPHCPWPGTGSVRAARAQEQPDHLQAVSSVSSWAPHLVMWAGVPGLPRWSEVSVFWVLCATQRPDPSCVVPINPVEVQVHSEENMFFWKFSLAYQSRTPHGVGFRGPFYFSIHHKITER